MKRNLMKGVCLTRGKETFACSSQGFQSESNNTSVNTSTTEVSVSPNG